MNDAINVPAVYKRQNPTNLTDSLNSVKKIILHIRFYSAVDPSFFFFLKHITVWPRTCSKLLVAPTCIDHIQSDCEETFGFIYLYPQEDDSYIGLNDIVLYLLCDKR